MVRFWKKDATESRHLELCCEPLERREMLAGNVSAHVTGAGNVVLDGDHMPNQIRIMQNGIGQVWVVGEDGTTVNGQGAYLLNETGNGTIEGNLKIRLKNGADRAVIRDVHVEGNVQAITGNQDDSFMMSRATVDGNVTIVTAQGSDLVQVVHSMLHGKLTINTAAGEDQVLIGLASDIDGRTSIATGSGLDKVFINNEFDGRLTINTGSNHDLVALHSMDVHQQFTVLMGSGDDNLFVHSLASYGQITVNGGGGHDVVYTVPGEDLGGKTVSIEQSALFPGTDLAVHNVGQTMVEYYVNVWDGPFSDYL